MIFATCRLITVLFFRFLGLTVFYFSKKRKPIALSNVNLCFTDKNSIEKKRNKKIVRDSFVSLGNTLADFLLLRFYNKKNIDKYVEFENQNYLYEAQRNGKGVIFFTAHFGSWELAAHFLALKGIKSLVLYNPIKTEKFLFLENWIKNNRQISGNVLISKNNSLLNVYKHLKRGGTVSFIADQHCSPREGVKITLFGNSVWSHKAFAELSLKTGSPIVFGFMFTKNLTKYVLKVYKPLYPQDFMKFKSPEYEIASSSNKILEDAILQNPGHWMWQHRRFKDV